MDVLKELLTDDRTGYIEEMKILRSVGRGSHIAGDVLQKGRGQRSDRTFSELPCACGR